MKRKIAIVLIAILVVVLSACSKGGETGAQGSTTAPNGVTESAGSTALSEKDGNTAAQPDEKTQVPTGSKKADEAAPSTSTAQNPDNEVKYDQSTKKSTSTTTKKQDTATKNTEKTTENNDTATTKKPIPPATDEDGWVTKWY